jgi:hypothetical protein
MTPAATAIPNPLQYKALQSLPQTRPADRHWKSPPAEAQQSITAPVGCAHFRITQEEHVMSSADSVAWRCATLAPTSQNRCCIDAPCASRRTTTTRCVSRGARTFDVPNADNKSARQRDAGSARRENARRFFPSAPEIVLAKILQIGTIIESLTWREVWRMAAPARVTAQRSPSC